MPADIRAVEPASYDHILLLGSDWVEDREESDARTVVSYLLLRDVLSANGGRTPRILVELFDGSNAVLFEDQPVDVLVSPLVVGRMLAQIAMRQELRAVFDQLLGSRGADLTVRTPRDYGIEEGEATFRRLQAAAMACGEILLGVRTAAGFELNPDHDGAWPCADETTLLALGE